MAGSEKSRGERGSTSYTGRSAARVKEDHSREAEDKSRGVLWKRRPRRGAVIRVRVDDREGSSTWFVKGVGRENVM